MKQSALTCLKKNKTTEKSFTKKQGIMERN